MAPAVHQAPPLPLFFPAQPPPWPLHDLGQSLRCPLDACGWATNAHIPTHPWAAGGLQQCASGMDRCNLGSVGRGPHVHTKPNHTHDTVARAAVVLGVCPWGPALCSSAPFTQSSPPPPHRIDLAAAAATDFHQTSSTTPPEIPTHPPTPTTNTDGALGLVILPSPSPPPRRGRGGRVVGRGWALLLLCSPGM